MQSSGGDQPFREFHSLVFWDMVRIQEGMKPEVKYPVERPSLNLR